MGTATTTRMGFGDNRLGNHLGMDFVHFFAYCICGHFGYDAVQGVCHWKHMICPQHWIIMVVSDGVPCPVVLVSYGLVYINLGQASEDEETSSH